MKKKAIENCIHLYVESINKADTEMAGKIFLQTEAISFIHPKGYAKGWEGVKKIYRMFNDEYSQRALEIYNEHIEIFKDMAVAVFDWGFNATFKTGGQKQTQGRETQIYTEIDGEYKIVHVHYSQIPTEDWSVYSDKD